MRGMINFMQPIDFILLYFKERPEIAGNLVSSIGAANPGAAPWL